MDPIAIAALRDKYVATFPDKKRQVAAACESAEGDPGALRQLLRTVHSLAGSGASFGMASVSQYCRAMESRVRLWLDDPELLDAAELDRWRTGFESLLDRLSDDPAWDGSVETPVPVELPVSHGPRATQASRVLVLDENPDTRRLLQLILGHQGYQVEVTGSGEDATALLDRSAPDLVIFDTDLLDSEGDRLLTRIRSSPALASVPICFLTPLEAGERPFSAPARALDDVIPRPFTASDVVTQVAVCLERRRLVTEHALTDPLTGVANRRAFFQRLGHELARLRRKGYPLAVMMLELDLAAGTQERGNIDDDHALATCARCLAGSVRPYDVVARLEGARFATILVGVDEDDARRAGERLLERVSALRLHLDDGRAITLDATAAMVWCADGWEGEPGRLMDLAARALERASQSGVSRLELVRV